MTRVAIPEAIDTLRNLTLERCRTSVQQALMRGQDADVAQTILELG